MADAPVPAPDPVPVPGGVAAPAGDAGTVPGQGGASTAPAGAADRGSAAYPRPAAGPRRWAAPVGEWLDAAAVLAVLAPVLLLARYLGPVADTAGWLIRFGNREPLPPVPDLTWPRVAVWLVITVATLRGWRRGAAAGAWAVAAGEATVLVARPVAYPAAGAPWPLLLSLLAGVVATLAAAAPTGPATAGRRGTALAGGIGLVPVAGAFVAAFLWQAAPRGGMESEEPTDLDLLALTPVDDRWPGGLRLLLYTLIAGLALALLAGIGPRVRRRVLALAAPPAVLVVTLARVFSAAYTDAVPGVPLPDHPRGILVLAGAPVLALIAGVALVAWRER